MSESPSKEALPKGVGLQPHLKTVHCFQNQIKPLRIFLDSLLNQVPSYSEPTRRQALIDHIQNVVISHGRDGLKLHRGLFIQGVKVLGMDRSLEFAGFKLTQHGYPRYYSELFQELAKIGSGTHVTTRSVPVTRENVGRLRFELQNMQLTPGTIIEVPTTEFREPTEEELRLVRIILSILRWPYSIKLPLSEQEKEVIVEDFASSITEFKYPKYLDKLVEYIDARLYRYLTDEAIAPLTFQPSSRTYKGGRPKKANERRLPISVVYAATDFRNLSFAYDGPVGNVSVISERAGKTRIVTNYDGAINSSNFYDKARAFLDSIPMDCSQNQGKGHKVAQSLTAKYQCRKDTAGLVSADLSAFTDNIHLTALEPILDMLRARDMIGVFNAPIMAGEREIRPLHPLMGLKGTFEVSSILHHGILHMMDDGTLNRWTRDTGHFKTDLKSESFAQYVMCGDDLLFDSDNCKIALERYTRLVEAAGLSLNRLKTVVSATTAIFCGKVYHKGYDVSPLVPPMFTLSKSYADFIQAGGTLVSEAKGISKGFVRSVKRLLTHMSRLWRGKYLPFELPKKLGGLDYPGSTGLISILEKVRNRVFVRFTADEDAMIEAFTVRYPYKDPKELPRFPWMSNLLIRGSTKRYRRRAVRNGLSNSGLKTVWECLVYYYS